MRTVAACLILLVIFSITYTTLPVHAGATPSQNFRPDPLPTQPAGSDAAARLGEVRTLMKAGDAAGAARALVALERAYPGRQTGSAIRRLGQEYYAHSLQLADALSKEVQPYPKLTYTRLLAARLYLASPKPAQAHPIIQGLMGRFPNDTSILRELANAVRQKGPSAAIAIEVRRRLVMLEPGSAQNSIDLAQAYLDNRQNNKALAEARRIAATWATNPSALAGAARIFARLKKWDEAKSAYKSAIYLDPASSSYYHLELAQIHLSSGNMRSAAEELILADTTPDYRQTSIGFHHRVPEEKRQAFADALAEALKGNSGLPGPSLVLAGTYIELKKPELARPLIESVLSQPFVDPELLNQIAEMTRRRGGPAGSADLMDLYIQAAEIRAAQEPPSSHSLFALARTYQEAGKTDEAYRTVKSIPDMWPDDQSVLGRAAQFMTEIKRWDEATALYQQIIAKNPKEAVSASLGLAEVYEAMGRPEDAVAILEDLPAGSESENRARIQRLMKLYLSLGRMEKLTNLMVSTRFEKEDKVGVPPSMISRQDVPKEKKQALADALAAISSKQQLSVPVQYLLAGLYVDLGRVQEARALVTMLIEKSAGDAAALGQLASLSAGSPALLDLRITALERAVDADPKSYHYAEQLMRLYVDSGKRERALTMARRIVETQPSNANALKSAAGVLEKLEKWDEAANAYSKALALDTGFDSYTARQAAMAYAKAGMTADSIAMYESIISNAGGDSDRLESFRDIIRLYVKDERYAQAADIVLRAEKSIRDPVMASQVIHAVIIQGMDKRKMADSLSRAIEKVKGYPISRTQLAHIYFDLGTPGTAVPVLQAAEVEADGNPAILRLISQAYLRDRNLAKGSIRILEGLREKRQAAPFDLLQLAEAYNQTGMRTKALEIARRIRIDGADTWFITRLALFFREIKQWDDAINLYKKAIPITPKEFTDSWNQGIAETLANAGRYSEALAIYRDLAERHPEETYGLNVLLLSTLKSLHEQQFPAAARGILEIARSYTLPVILHYYWQHLHTLPEADQRALAGELEPVYYERDDSLEAIGFVLSQFYAATGESEKAGMLARRLMSRTSHAEILTGLVAVSHRLQDYRLAADLYERVVPLQPDHYPYLYYLGQSYALAGDKLAAASQAKMLAEKWPDKVDALYYAGDLYYSIGQYDDAITHFGKAVQLADTSAAEGGHDYLWQRLIEIANAYVGLGEKEKALEYYRMAEKGQLDEDRRAYVKQRIKELGQ